MAEPIETPPGCTRNGLGRKDWRVLKRFPWAKIAAAVVLWAPVVTAAQANADPNALWTIVHDQCVRDQQMRADPAPCSLVQLGAGQQRGYAVLKDLVGPTQFLLIPTGRITGIESPDLLEPQAPNYFAAAWDARSFVNARAGVELSRDWISLAINSAQARTQDQLHIHVDCVRADIRETLQRHLDDVGPNWAPLPEPLHGHPYLAMTVAGDNLDAVNPIQLVAQRVAAASDDMNLETVVVVGTYLADGQPGFIVLSGRADPAAGDFAAGEELQDHTNCPPPRGEREK